MTYERETTPAQDRAEGYIGLLAIIAVCGLLLLALGVYIESYGVVMAGMVICAGLSLTMVVVGCWKLATWGDNL